MRILCGYRCSISKYRIRISASCSIIIEAAIPSYVWDLSNQTDGVAQRRQSRLPGWMIAVASQSVGGAPCGSTRFLACGVDASRVPVCIDRCLDRDRICVDRERGVALHKLKRYVYMYIPSNRSPIVCRCAIVRSKDLLLSRLTKRCEFRVNFIYRIHSSFRSFTTGAENKRARAHTRNTAWNPKRATLRCSESSSRHWITIGLIENPQLREQIG